jgi:hypothetical protein
MKLMTMLSMTFIFLCPVRGESAQQGQPAGQTGNDTQPNASRQISERTARKNKSSVGFSLGVVGLYDSNFSNSSTSKDDQGTVSFMPRVFANLSRRNSYLYLNYQFSYRRYPGRNEMNSSDQAAGLEYSLQPARNLRLRLADNVQYRPNDILTLLGTGMTGNGQQVFFDNKKILSNSTSGTASYTITRNHRVDLSGWYDLTKYQSRPEENTDTVGVRASDEFQFMRQLSLTAEVSNEWVHSVNGVRNGKIVRFLGGMRLRLHKAWVIGGQGGADRTNMASQHGVQPSYQAFVTRESPANRLDMRYSRSYGFQVGLPGLNPTDSVAVLFDQRLMSRLSFNILSRYYRTSGLQPIGRVDSVNGRVGFEYALTPSFLASVSGDYLYQRQKVSTATLVGLNLDKFIITAGLYYFFPATNRR